MRKLLLGIGIVIAMTALDSGMAHAQRRMIVLIDASGSMTLPRPGDVANPTRFHAAKSRSTDAVLAQEMAGLAGVAVYTFQDTTVTARTAGFVDVNTALDAIDALDPNATPFGATPLAGSMCDMINIFIADTATTKILQVSSDGEENFTPMAHECWGPFSMSPTYPYTLGSWQNLVAVKAEGAAIVQVDLFTSVAFGLAASRGFDPEAALVAKAGRATARIATLDEERPPTLVEFFTALTQHTGGTLTVVDDVAPVPILGDFTADQCVDRSDLIAHARAFGGSDARFDLNLDGKVDYADYTLERARVMPSCAAPDPYVQRAPVVCNGAKTVTIDANVIEDGSFDINATGACRIIIRNAMLVSGQNTINIVGSAFITVDNSLLVGPNWLRSTGAVFLSAGNTIFHGARQTSGGFHYVDRGGNVFE
jgi:hypothetical protein